VHIASNPAIREALSQWDVSMTDKLIIRWKARQEEKRAAEIALHEKGVQGAEDEVEAAKEESDCAFKALKHARMVSS